MVRAKFRLTEVHSYPGGSQKFIFRAVCSDEVPENQRFAKYTPNGHMEMQVDNPEAQKQFQVGDHYYFDISPVPAAAPIA